MNRSLHLTFVLGIFILSPGYAKTYLQKQTFMELGQAEQRYGIAKFSPGGFKNSNSSERAKMSVSLIKSRRYLGKYPKEVLVELGPSTGHFWSNEIPAYFIEEGWKGNSDTWQLVFLLDDNRKVSEIKIHKNCCPNK